MDLCATCLFTIGADRKRVTMRDREGEIIRDSKGNELVAYPTRYREVRMKRSYVHGLNVDTSIPPEPPKPKRQRKIWEPTPEWLARMGVKQP
jgi:hypothetical protein